MPLLTAVTGGPEFADSARHSLEEWIQARRATWSRDGRLFPVPDDRPMRCLWTFVLVRCGQLALIIRTDTRSATNKIQDVACAHRRPRGDR